MRNILLIIVLLAQYGILVAQMQPASLLDKLIDSSLVIVQSEYVLRDSFGDDYVRTENYYSKINNIAVCANNNIYFAEPATHPWKTDAGLNKIDLTGGKRPVLSNILARTVTQLESSKINLLYIDTITQSIEVNEVDSGLMSIDVSKEKGLLDAWVVLICTTEYMSKQKTQSFKKILFERKIMVENGFEAAMHLIPDLEMQQGCIGGLILQPTIITGFLKLKLLGLVFSNTEKETTKLFWQPIQTGSDLKKIEKVQKSTIVPEVGKDAAPSKSVQEDDNNPKKLKGTKG